jgi:hypothetical protein
MYSDAPNESTEAAKKERKEKKRCLKAEMSRKAGL